MLSIDRMPKLVITQQSRHQRLLLFIIIIITAITGYLLVLCCLKDITHNGQETYLMVCLCITVGHSLLHSAFLSLPVVKQHQPLILKTKFYIHLGSITLLESMLVFGLWKETLPRNMQTPFRKPVSLDLIP